MSSSRGCFRRYVSKPITRKAYKLGNEFTLYYIQYYVTKYLTKYIIKRNKMGVGVVISPSVAAEIAIRVTNGLVFKTLSKKDLPGVERVIRDAMAGTGRRVHVTLSGKHCCASSMTFAERGHESDSDNEEEDSSDDERVVPVFLPEEEEETVEVDLLANDTVHEIALFAAKIYEKAASNKGLDHGKTKEYWLERGPRKLMTMCFFLAFTLTINETLGTVSSIDRLKACFVAGMAMLISFFMLYHRLPDAINSAILRSCHDTYVTEKKKKLKKKVLGV